MVSATASSLEISGIIERIGAQAKSESVASVNQMIEVYPKGQTRALKTKKRPTKPPWLAGIAG